MRAPRSAQSTQSGNRDLGDTVLGAWNICSGGSGSADSERACSRMQCDLASRPERGIFFAATGLEPFRRTEAVRDCPPHRALRVGRTRETPTRTCRTRWRLPRRPMAPLLRHDTAERRHQGWGGLRGAAAHRGWVSRTSMPRCGWIVTPVAVPGVDDLRPLRQATNITFNPAANQFGVWPTTISEFERGIRRNDDPCPDLP
jgi:hypothetical protein